MEKSTLSVLALCLSASGAAAHAEPTLSIETLQVLEENQISVEEYRDFAERYPDVRKFASVSAGNYDTFNGNLTAGNYNTFNSNTTSGNYDTFNGNTTSGNYNTFNGNTTSGNYNTFNGSPLSQADIDQIQFLRELPSPQAND